MFEQQNGWRAYTGHPNLQTIPTLGLRVHFPYFGLFGLRVRSLVETVRQGIARDFSQVGFVQQLAAHTKRLCVRTLGFGLLMAGFVLSVPLRKNPDRGSNKYSAASTATRPNNDDDDDDDDDDHDDEQEPPLSLLRQAQQQRVSLERQQQPD